MTTDFDATLIRSVPAVDVLAVDGVMLVLFEARLVTLNPLGGSLYSFCVEPRTLAEVADHLTAEWGRPEGLDVREAVVGIVRDLAEEGLVAATPELP